MVDTVIGSGDVHHCECDIDEMLRGKRGVGLLLEHGAVLRRREERLIVLMDR